MKFSIITAVFNNKEFIEYCIKSVLSQTYKDIEYIVVDGGSTDGTLEIIDKYKGHIHKIISEKDNSIYEALNKGIAMATGEVVGFLNSDDVYLDERVIEKVSGMLEKHNVESLYGDLIYVDKKNLHKIIRYWRAGKYKEGFFRIGWMPPHPTFFVKKSAYEKYGYFDSSFKISADYELMLRFLYKHRISTLWLPEVLIKMRWGGKSNKSAGNIIRKIIEDCRACKLYGLGYPTIFIKNIIKFPQFFNRVSKK